MTATKEDIKNAVDGAERRIHDGIKGAEAAGHKAAEAASAVGKHVKAQWVGIAILALAVIVIGGQAVGLF